MAYEVCSYGLCNAICGGCDVHNVRPLQLLLQIMNVNCWHFTVITELVYSISGCP